MKTRASLILGGLSILFFSAPSPAEHTSGFYVKPYLGISYMNDVTNNKNTAPIEIELDKGLVLGTAFGYHFTKNFAAELAWEYRSNDSETQVGNLLYPEGNYAANIFFVNGLYYFSPIASVRPYLGLGLGWIQEIDIDLEREGVERSFSSSGNFTYQGFIGVEYQLSSNWRLHTELRHAGAKSGNLKDERTGELLANLNYKPFTWQLGFSYLF